MNGQVKNEGVLSQDLKSWAKEDQLPPGWPSAGRVWWRWTILQRLRQEQLGERRAQRSWLPSAALAGLSCLCLVLLNFVFWSALEGVAESMAAAGLAQAPLLYYLGICLFMTTLLVPMLSWLWMLLSRSPD